MQSNNNNNNNCKCQEQKHKESDIDSIEPMEIDEVMTAYDEYASEESTKNGDPS